MGEEVRGGGAVGGRGRAPGEEEQRGLLTWPLGNASLPSPAAAISSASRALLAADFFPAPVCLDCLVPKGTRAHLLDLPSSGTREIGGKVAGSRGAAETLCPQEGKLFPEATLEASPGAFFSWATFFLEVARGRPPAAATAAAPW